MPARELLSTFHFQDSATQFDFQDMDFIAALQAGCLVSFSFFYDHYAPALMGVILRAVKNEVLAEEILEETFITVSNSFQSYQGSKERLFTWMAAIARNKIEDKLNTNSR